MTTSRLAFSYSLPVTLATETFCSSTFHVLLLPPFYTSRHGRYGDWRLVYLLYAHDKKAYTRDDKGLRS